MFSDKNEASPQASTPRSQQTDRPSRRAALVEGAINAAFDVIDLCKSLYDNIGLARAGYTEFSSCRAALLLLLAQSLREYDKKTSEVISLGIQLLKVMATGNNVSTRSETSVIEAIEGAVRKVHSGLAHNGTEMVNEEPEHDMSKSEYERFKEWTSLWKMPDTGRENVNSQGHHDPIQASLQASGPSWAGSFESMPGSLVCNTSEMSDLGMEDIMNAFPHGILGGEWDDWPRLV